ncbi:PLD nuclease N-terminal domain-containing protein [Couchioplanes caeruleus]|uniref:Cardiolipin synthase N-terminal domain-containing protein n=3 Tax=Couchioplanes caeruleus TaxID=56438 RepID=A0A1K0GBZ2_9ACTN|nr:PLD nuclease N-terminal domain-containing protein [Couchioplanes caeruleus]OJF14754.1 hypothetical protein BG844_08190 [Couchioplanes caeruleus subsp. caeruleus]ROP29268.1 phospholipase D-like protein [Couchioplanes caeruleus]
MANPHWSDLPRWQKAGTLIVAPAEIVLTALAVADLIRRPSAEVRGPKALWWAGLLVQPLGPIAYLAWGRSAGRRI